MATKQEIIEAIIKSNIGDVADGIDKAAKKTEDLAQATDKVDGGMKKASGGVKKLAVGFGTLAKASGIIFIINKAFEAFQEVASKNQTVLDGFRVATEMVSIAFNDLFKFIQSNVGAVTGFFKELFENPVEKIKEMRDAIKEGIIDRFNQLKEVLGLVGKAFGQLIKGEFSAAFDTIKEAGKESVDVITGVDGSFEQVKETIKDTVEAVKDYTKSTYDQAKALVESEKAANRAAVEFAKLNADFLKQAEEQRQIRDDETKTFAERIEANNKLNEILAQQQELQRDAIQKQIDYAQAQYDINASEENYIALQEAKVSMLELEETITGQLSEQKTNAVSLAKELQEAENELALVGKTNRELELAELRQTYDAKLELARKAGVDTLAIEEEFLVKEKEINDAYDEEELAKAKEIADAKRQIAFDMLNAIAENLQASLDFQAEALEENYEKETESVNNRYDKQIEAAKQAGKSTVELEKAKEREQKKIDKKAEKDRIKNAKAQKKLQVAMATIETFKSATAAFSALAPIPIVGPALGIAAAAAAVVAGLANVRKILKQDVGGGAGGGGGESGGGSGGGAPATAQPQAPAPSMMSGKFELGGAIKPEPVKAFVVTDEMTDSQNQLEGIRKESTL